MLFVMHLALILVATAAESPGPWSWLTSARDGQKPEDREGHAAVQIGDLSFIMGGCQLDIKCFADVWSYDASNGIWTIVETSGEGPSSRGGHTAVAFGQDMLIFGGANSDETYNDVYKLDTTTGRWYRGVAATEDKPPARTGHASASHRDGQLFVHGGYSDDGRYLDDMWLLELQDPRTGGDEASFSFSWRQVVQAGSIPPARESHSLTAVNGKLVLIGGYTTGGLLEHDVSVFDPDSGTWAVPTPANPYPGARQGHSATRHGRRVILAGGCDISSQRHMCYGDVWELDTTSWLWTARTPAAAGFAPREGHSATFRGGDLVIFGGCEMGTRCYSDTVMLQTQDPCPDNCSGQGSCESGTYCVCNNGFGSHDCSQVLQGTAAASPVPSKQVSSPTLEVPPPNALASVMPQRATISRCPMDCCARGACQQGSCHCKPGWRGASCSVPESMFVVAQQAVRDRAQSLRSEAASQEMQAQEADQLLRSLQSNTGSEGTDAKLQVAQLIQRTRDLRQESVGLRRQAEQLDRSDPAVVGVEGLLSPQSCGAVDASEIAAFHSQLSTKSRKVGLLRESSTPKRRNKDFGIYTNNTEIKPGVQKPECEDNCNYRGVCEEGVCYCEPGHYGKTCASVRHSKKGTISLTKVLIIGACCAGGALLVSLGALMIMERKKKSMEQSMGYRV
mmetsp:Transcript_31973/g.76650  ORF Transcript_31973/g.76650 Transcript_31973/m.76650 type:complete len:677 (+) Transcript_31973:36-2066(+)